MKRKPLSHYLDLMKSAQDKQEWGKEARYGETALKKLSALCYSSFDKYLLYSRLGFAYNKLSKYSISLDMYYTTHLIASKYHLAPEQVAYVNHKLGHNLRMLHHYNQAISQFLKVEEYYQKHGDEKIPMDKNQHFVTLVNLGWCYLYKGELEKTHEIIQEKLVAYQNTLALNIFSEYYYHLKGSCLMEQKEYTQSRQSFNELLKVSLTLNDFYLVCAAKFELAEIDLFEGQLDFAIKNLNALLKDIQRLELNEFTCIVGLVLSKCHLLKNMPAKSASVEKMIKPLLKSLDITWFYELNRELELLYRRLQPVYQNRDSLYIPKIITNKIEEHFQSSSYANIIIGKANSMIEVYQLIEKIAPTDLPVLIQGETGTGKELVARAIHNNSLRKGKIWLAANCGALSETLLENELFGHTKGAFTDAKEDKKGYIELASNGTLFLDEIGDMSPAMQQKLLRILEEKLVWRLGAQKPVPVNTRFIFASNQNIEELVKQKRFREDLYYRINTIVITLPSLRDRKEDMPLLLNHFFAKYSPTKTYDAQHTTHDAIQISPSVLNLLINYSWPGNVRELENEVKRNFALYPNIKTITEEMLSEPIRNYLLTKGKITIKELTDAFHKKIIEDALEKNKGNRTETARQLGYTWVGLYKKMKQLKMKTTE